MKYFSEETKKTYDTVEELEEAENKLAEIKKEKEEKLALRGERAKEVEEAFKEVKVAQDKANDLLDQFLKDYGTYHSTIRVPVHDLFSTIWDRFFDFGF
jgi:predicted ribosome quality control (RQC) complex YloA/Tae2 family protein